MTRPTIHLNGSAPERLRDGYVDAARGLNAAITGLLECAPNGRDYYPQGPDAFTTARAAHDRDLEQLRAMRDRYAADADWIDEQIIARARR